MESKAARNLGIACAIITGLASWFIALLALVNDYNWVGVGVCLAAAAIAFGSLSRTT